MDIKIQTLGLTAADVKNSVQSFNASMRFIKRVCKIGLLNILYRRLHVDKKGFEGKRHRGIPYVIYVRKTDNPIIRMYHGWMYGIIDAIENKYLKSVYVYFVNKDTEKVLEYYKFQLQYNEKEISVKKSVESLEEQTDKLFKFLLDLKDIPKLNGNVEPRIELRYMDETPEEYEPPNFNAETKTLMEKVPAFQAKKFVNLNTGYHKLKGTACGKVDVELRATTTMDHQVIEVDDAENKSIIELDVSNNLNNTIRTPSITEDYDHISFTEDFSETDFQCYCKVNNPSLNLETFECAKCAKHYHKYCVGIFKYIPKNYQCVKCNSEGDVLSKIPPAQYQDLTKMRIVLALCYKNSKFPVELFKSFSKRDQENLLTTLKMTNVITNESTADNCEMIEHKFTAYLLYLFKDLEQKSL